MSFTPDAVTQNVPTGDGDVQVASSNAPSPDVPERPCRTGKRKADRPFDIHSYPKRKIVLRLAYHGQNHEGLAKQSHTGNTVESILCDALKKVRLVPEDGPEDFSRCGRTDKGVSALGNAVSLRVRAAAAADDGDATAPPFDYCKMLNHVLPPTVRVTGWSFVDDTFDARFSCVSRTYRYFFLRTGLDLEAMATAASYLVGTHNFRNFCCLDVVNVQSFTRTVERVSIQPSSLMPEHIAFLEIKANAFLYHQIRCTMTVLLLVGRSLEKPDIVREMLAAGDCKPIYPLADHSPLVLWDCEFPTVTQWNLSESALSHLQAELSDISTALLIRAASSHDMREHIAATSAIGEAQRESSEHGVADEWTSTGCDWTNERNMYLLRKRRSDLYAARKSDGPSYVPLWDRERERPYEEVVESLNVTKKARRDTNMSKGKAPTSSGLGTSPPCT